MVDLKSVDPINKELIAHDRTCSGFRNFKNRSNMTENSQLKIVPLTKWGKHFSYPSQGTMRNIVARREDNNAGEFLSMIHGRFYVDVEKFHLWLQEQSTFRRKNEI